MANLLEQTLVHYSKKPLTKLEDVMSGQMKLLNYTGKPAGFWYAYDDTWKKYILSKKKSSLGHDEKNTEYRYEFRLPNDIFVKDLDHITPNKIFQLSFNNLDKFMKKIINEKEDDEKYNITLEGDILQIIVEDAIQKGGSSILEEIANKNKDYAQYYNELIERNNTNEDNDEKEEKNYNIIDNLITFFPNGYTPSIKAQQDDGMFLFDWYSFWKDVGDKMGGIEFEEDLFKIKMWNDIYLPWTSKLDVHSGVIFHPSTFNNKILIQQLITQKMNGGRIQTRRKRRNMRKTKGKKSKNIF